MEWARTTGTDLVSTFLERVFCERKLHCSVKTLVCFCVAGRVLLRRARKLAQQYFLVYQEPIPTAQLVQRVASVMQEYTQSGYVPICSLSREWF